MYTHCSVKITIKRLANKDEMLDYELDSDLRKKQEKRMNNRIRCGLNRDTDTENAHVYTLGDGEGGRVRLTCTIHDHA